MADTPAPAPRPAPGVVIDPRIRRRRIEVKREEGRRRLRVLVATLAVTATMAAGVGVTRSPLLDVDYVDVRGAASTPRSDLLEATGLAGHPLMVEVDSRRAERGAEALPWVLSARVRKDWPKTVRVDVVERRPVAVIPAGTGRWALADARGRVLAVGAAKPAGLPVIGNVVPPRRPGQMVGPRARAALAVIAAVPRPLRFRVADVATVAGGEVEVHLLPPGAVARLGRPEDLEAKFLALTTVLDHVDHNRLAVVDVRVPAAPVLTRR